MFEKIFNDIVDYIIFIIDNDPKGFRKPYCDPVRCIEGFEIDGKLIGYYLFGEEKNMQEITDSDFRKNHRVCYCHDLVDAVNKIIYTICCRHNVFAARLQTDGG